MTGKSARRRWLIGSLVVALWLAVLAGCDQGTTFDAGPRDLRGTSAAALAGAGDPQRGRELIAAVGCSACHTVPGVRDARGAVGPPLDFWSERMYIAGRLLNSPDSTAAWLLAPQAVAPGTVMPNMNLEEPQARDITAYLYTLRRERTKNAPAGAHGR